MRHGTMAEPRRIITRAEDLPSGLSEEEEDRFWDDHELGGELLGGMRTFEERPIDDLDTRAVDHS